MPEDPITENMNILNMKPVKAFLYQDHEAHITVHMNAMKDPKIAALVGQNPQAQAIQAAALAHIQQHLAFEYRKQMEQLMQIPLPNPENEEDQIPRDQEVQLSIMAAQASDALLQRNQTEIAAQQAEQAKQDPVIQMQAQELQLKQAEEQRKAAKDQADVQEAAQRLELERERIASQERIAAAQIQAKIGKDQADIEIKALQAMKQPQTGNRQ
jgi:glycerol-3-phosphate dehydrogenase